MRCLLSKIILYILEVFSSKGRVLRKHFSLFGRVEDTVFRQIVLSKSSRPVQFKYCTVGEGLCGSLKRVAKYHYYAARGSSQASIPSGNPCQRAIGNVVPVVVQILVITRGMVDCNLIS